MEEAYSYKVSKIGSSPPSCEHRCYGLHSIRSYSSAKHQQQAQPFGVAVTVVRTTRDTEVREVRQCRVPFVEVTVVRGRFRPTRNAS
ncbi:hypothetical protein JHK87_055610 [Glycine soja]|nr:hypothetical protein JHK87_055610 [Glycine soja]